MKTAEQHQEKQRLQLRQKYQQKEQQMLQQQQQVQQSFANNDGVDSVALDSFCDDDDDGMRPQKMFAQPKLAAYGH